MSNPFDIPPRIQPPKLGPDLRSILLGAFTWGAVFLFLSFTIGDLSLNDTVQFDTSDCTVFYDEGFDGPFGEVNAVRDLTWELAPNNDTAPGGIKGINDPGAKEWYQNYLKYHMEACGRIGMDEKDARLVDFNNACPVGYEFLPFPDQPAGQVGTSGVLVCPKEVK